MLLGQHNTFTARLPSSSPPTITIITTTTTTITGGRLVFFVPVSPETDDPADLPDHPSMALAASCLQPLSGRYGRRLLTFSKDAPFDAAQSHAWREARRGFLMAIERVSDLVWETRDERAARSGAADGAGAPPPPRPRRENSGGIKRDGGGGGGGGGDGGSNGDGKDEKAAAEAERELAHV